MKRLLILLLLVVPKVAWGQVNVTAPLTHPCPAGIEFVKAQVLDFPSDWTVVVVCDSSDFENVGKEFHPSKKDGGAFTNLRAKRTYVLYDRLKTADRQRIPAFLDHELKHIRCQCSLGEK